MLDTNVVSFLMKGDTRAELFRAVIEGKRACLSFATVAELYKGFLKAGIGDARMARFERELRNYVVLPYDVAVSRACGRLLADREATGLPMEEFDAWIAATAIAYALPLVTHNVRHFAGVAGLTVLPGADPRA